MEIIDPIPQMQVHVAHLPRCVPSVRSECFEFLLHCLLLASGDNLVSSFEFFRVIKNIPLLCILFEELVFFLELLLLFIHLTGECSLIQIQLEAEIHV